MIKYLVMDVDGTLTDGKIYMGQDGEMMKAFNVKDGYGIHNLLEPEGIVPVIITGRTSQIVINRCNEMNVRKVFQGVSDKGEVLKTLTGDLSEVAYIGDDLNDMSCIRIVKEAKGLVGCPSDSVKEVIEISDFVAEHKGGDGAVRDFIEWIIKQNKGA